jgi:hypothetical protein
LQSAVCTCWSASLHNRNCADHNLQHKRKPELMKAKRWHEEIPGDSQGRSHGRSQVSWYSLGKGRVELPRLAAHDPKSCLSANSSTSPSATERDILPFWLILCLPLMEANSFRRRRPKWCSLHAISCLSLDFAFLLSRLPTSQPKRTLWVLTLATHLHPHPCLAFSLSSSPGDGQRC